MIYNMDVNKLLKALDDDSNENLLNFNTKKIKETTLSILSELELPKKQTMDLYKQLLYYKYVDEMSDLKCGTYIRWIPISQKHDLKLRKGAIFCEFKITDEGVQLICKNYGFNNRHFQIQLDNNLIFQKLTDQELVLLSALDHLSK